MNVHRWYRSPASLFLAVLLVLAATLGWLGWQLLQQDRVLETQRTQERLDSAADLIAASLLRNLSESKAQLTGLLALSEPELSAKASGIAGQGNGAALLVVLHAQAVAAHPPARLLYCPFLPAAKVPPATVFEASEVSEFQRPLPAVSARTRTPLPTRPSPR